MRKIDYEALKDWAVGKNVKVSMYANPGLLRRLSPPDVEIIACTFPQPMPYRYIIYTFDGFPSTDVYIHELVHILQFENGELSVNGDWQYVWRGRTYPSDTPYNSRPWEQEAFSRGRKLYKKYRQTHKENESENK